MYNNREYMHQIIAMHRITCHKILEEQFMVPQKQISRSQAPSWVMLPLRLFLGGTFVYAGVQKFTDPEFLQPSAAGFIGKQLVAFATGSPLHTVLLQIAVPHALFFGYLIAYTELAIGLCTLFGALMRPMAFVGMLLNTTFFLSASWHVYPFYYGSDIVFAFCWLTMLLNGPINTGLPSFDELLALTIVQYARPERQLARARLLSFLLGVPGVRTLPDAASVQVDKRRKMLQRSSQARRNFLFGTLSGGAAMFGVLGAFYLLSKWLMPPVKPVPATVSHITTAPPAPDSTPTADPSTADPSTTDPSTTHISSGTVITRTSAVPRNNAVAFTLSASGDPGVLIHTQSDKFVAFDATCTHAGCQVDYDPSIHLLACPCHGSMFDPDQQAKPVQGPAVRPLAAVAIRVDSATGAIVLQ
jgi:thiosulfate dehydrogenase (quinone) large subunit